MYTTHTMPHFSSVTQTSESLPWPPTTTHISNSKKPPVESRVSTDGSIRIIIFFAFYILRQLDWLPGVHPARHQFAVSRLSLGHCPEYDRKRYSSVHRVHDMVRGENACPDASCYSVSSRGLCDASLSHPEDCTNKHYIVGMCKQGTLQIRSKCHYRPRRSSRISIM